MNAGTDRSEESHKPSVEQMEKELAELHQFRQKTYEFLHLFCNYEIKSPLLTILRYSELLLNHETLVVNDKGSYLSTIERQAQQILIQIDAVRDAAGFERRDLPHSRHELYREHYPSERMDLWSVLQKAISQAVERADNENEAQTQMDKLANELERFLSPKAELARVLVNIPDEVPPVMANPYFLEKILIDVTWFVANRFMLNEIAFDVGFTKEWVSVTISYLGRDAINEPSDLLQLFDTSSTFLALDPRVLTLYNSWQLLKLYNAQMEFKVEDNIDNRGLSKVSVTVNLPTYHEPTNQQNNLYA